MSVPEIQKLYIEEDKAGSRYKNCTLFVKDIHTKMCDDVCVIYQVNVSVSFGTKEESVQFKVKNHHGFQF